MRARTTSIIVACFALAAACERDRPKPTPSPPPAAITVFPAAPEAKPNAPVKAVAIERISTDVREGSAIALARVAGVRVAFVADEDEQAIHTIDVVQRREIARTPVGGTPAKLLVLGDGTLAASLRDRGVVVLLTASSAHAPLSVASTLQTADEPIALALPPDGKTLWVASGWGRRLEGFGIEDRHLRTTLPLGREPRGLAIADHGRYAFVSHMSLGGVAVIDLQASRVTVSLHRRITATNARRA